MQQNDASKITHGKYDSGGVYVEQVYHYDRNRQVEAGTHIQRFVLSPDADYVYIKLEIDAYECRDQPMEVMVSIDTVHYETVQNDRLLAYENTNVKTCPSNKRCVCKFIPASTNAGGPVQRLLFGRRYQ